jgi:hypothetical protein
MISRIYSNRNEQGGKVNRVGIVCDDANHCPIEVWVMKRNRQTGELMRIRTEVMKPGTFESGFWVNCGNQHLEIYECDGHIEIIEAEGD